MFAEGDKRLTGEGGKDSVRVPSRVEIVGASVTCQPRSSGSGVGKAPVGTLSEHWA